MSDQPPSTNKFSCSFTITVTDRDGVVLRDETLKLTREIALVLQEYLETLVASLPEKSVVVSRIEEPPDRKVIEIQFVRLEDLLDDLPEPNVSFQELFRQTQPSELGLIFSRQVRYVS